MRVAGEEGKPEILINVRDLRGSGMRPKIDEATLALGELAGKRFNEYNEETEYGFRVRLDKLLAKDLKK